MANLYNYKIGFGAHNLPDGSLQNIEEIMDLGQGGIFAPDQFGNYLPGVRRTRAGTTAYISGEPSDAWNYGYITRDQEAELRSRNGGYEGLVTYTTMIGNYGDYTRHNAILSLPFQPEAGADFGIFPNYTMSFSQVSGTLT